MKVVRWIEGQTARTPAQALALLRAQPGGPLVPTPYRFVDRKAFEDVIDNADINRRIDTAPIVDMPIATFCSIQHTCERKRVEDYLTDPKRLRPRRGQKDPRHGGLIDYPIIVRAHRQNLIFDGHHRTYAALLLGARFEKVRFVDLDAAGYTGTAKAG